MRYYSMPVFIVSIRLKATYQTGLGHLPLDFPPPHIFPLANRYLKFKKKPLLPLFLTLN